MQEDFYSFPPRGVLPFPSRSVPVSGRTLLIVAAHVRALSIILVGTVIAAAAPAQTTSHSPSQNSQQGQQPNPQQNENQSNQPSILTPLKPQTQAGPYHPITASQRLRWIVTDTIGPPHLVGGAIISAFGTALDRPKEDGPHWGGFAERFGVRLTGVATSNLMEAGIGAVWGEDPRYFRVPDETFGARVKNVMKLTFYARERDGSYAPAYARYMAFAGNNFLSNSWRPDSEANDHDAVLRTLEAFAGRMTSNAFEEFWPSLKAKVFHHSQ
jgi:hypothetical protein